MVKQFVVGGGGWCKPILVLSFGFDQAEQYIKTIKKQATIIGCDIIVNLLEKSVIFASGM
jgi:hypothetical protein